MEKYFATSSRIKYFKILRAPHPEIMERFPPENCTVPAPLTFLIRRHFSDVSQ